MLWPKVTCVYDCQITSLCLLKKKIKRICGMYSYDRVTDCGALEACHSSAFGVRTIVMILGMFLTFEMCDIIRLCRSA